MTARLHGRAARFLSTLPARGATGDKKEWYLDAYKFLSTLPARGATAQPAGLAFDDLLISIHAPREGSDLRPT